MRKVLPAAGLLAMAVLAVFLLKFGPVLREADIPAQQTRFDEVGEPLWEVPDFSLVNTRGQTVSRRDLRDKVWIAAFIFTRCPGPCPLITQRMAEARRNLEEVEDFRLVSFTVDPGYDRPETLKKYAEQWDADSEKWLFLTSPEPDDQLMLNLALDFKVAASRQRAADESDVPAITHGTNILLVDRVWRVRAIYDSVDPETPSRIAEGVGRLTAR